MKGRLIAYDMIAGRKAAAMVVDGVLEDLLVDGGDGPAPGAIYRAICDRPMKGQGGMMLRLPKGSAYLRKGKGLAPGQPLLVQVTGRAEDGKAVPVTARVLFKSRYAIVTPGAPGINISRQIRDDEARVQLLEIAHEAMEGVEDGLIIRSDAEGADEDDVEGDILDMRDLALAVAGDADGKTPELLVDGPDAHSLGWRDWPSPDQMEQGSGCFARNGVDEMIATILNQKCTLPGGAFAFIEQTRALVAIDVNTGGDTSQAAGLKANIALARDLPRQLRCRGLGGQIVVDFAPMPKKDRRQLEQVLRAAFRKDPVETALAGWTPLGHFELQRKRERAPLSPELQF
ncbi:MAG: ribonuclease G [Rhodobacteraceae bacterium]|nr:ribonuclease G [Paracoccaceae bacterium]